MDDKKDSPIQSENEEEVREETVGYRDPNDADSEASMLDRLSNAGSSRRCSEITAGGEVGIGGLPNNLCEVPAEKENEEESSHQKDKARREERSSLSSRGSSSSSSSRLSPLVTGNSFKALPDEQSGTTDEEKKVKKEDGNSTKEGEEVKSVRNKMAALSLNENGKEAPKVNGFLSDTDEKSADGHKENSNSVNCKEEAKEENGVEEEEGKSEKLHGGNERTIDGPTAIAPLARIHELGESFSETNHVDAKKDKATSTPIAAEKEEASTPANKASATKTGKPAKTIPHPLPNPAKLAASTPNATSPPISPVSPTSRARVASTLAPRYQPKNQECSVMSCLNQFTAPELLTGSNRFGCEICSKSHKGGFAYILIRTITPLGNPLYRMHLPTLDTFHG